MRVIGLDLSLTATGFALIEDDTITVRTITSKPIGDGWVLDRVQRLDKIERAVMEHMAGASEIDLIVIEGPSFGQMRQSGEHVRAGLWWRIVSICTDTAPVVEVPPATLKKYATGKGNAAKDAVLLATARRFPDVDLLDNNQADALWLAAMGARHLEQPIDDVPQLNQTAMAAVRWPS